MRVVSKIGGVKTPKLCLRHPALRVNGRRALTAGWRGAGEALAGGGKDVDVVLAVESQGVSLRSQAKRIAWVRQNRAATEGNTEVNGSRSNDVAARDDWRLHLPTRIAAQRLVSHRAVSRGFGLRPVRPFRELILSIISCRVDEV